MPEQSHRFPPRFYPDGIDWDAPLPAVPLFAMLDDTAKFFGDRPAIDFLGHKMTWRQVNEASLRLARSLQDRGVGKGAKIGLFLPNCPYYLIAYFAIARTGATIVNFNPLYSERELAAQIEDSGTGMIVTTDLAMLFDKMTSMVDRGVLETIVVCRFADMLPLPKNLLFPILKKKEIASIGRDRKNILWYHDLLKHENAPHPVSIDPEHDVALLQYTGGTTGTPKGAMLTHANVVVNTRQCALWLDATKGEEKMLGVLPFFHVFAMTTVMNFSVLNALEIICLPRFELEATLKLIHKKKPHYFPAVPAIYNAVNNYKQLAKYDLRSLKSCISGGAPLPVEVKKAFEKNTGCIVVEGYGLTESSPVVSANPLKGVNKAGSIGLPVPGTTVEIVDIEDRRTSLPSGERGELCVKGPQVMKGYWNRPEESHDVLRDGRLHTGDIAIIDKDGYIFIVDRLKDMIITNGYNVYPRNVEEAIYCHDAVEECIVAGLPDQNRGEIVKAWIKLKDGASLDVQGLRTFLTDHLSPMEIPKQVEFRTEPLPKTMIGKLSRKDIVAQELSKKA